MLVVSFVHRAQPTPLRLVETAAVEPGCPANRCPLLPAYPVSKLSLRQVPGSVEQLLKAYQQTSVESVRDLIAARQNPTNCAAARYMLMDDISTASGLGYSMLNMVPLALQVRPKWLLPVMQQPPMCSWLMNNPSV